ncbi:MAG: CoA-binding protein [Defluviicoccus sp.]
MSAAPPALAYDDAWLREILSRVRRIAVVGASANFMRPSHWIMAFLQERGYGVVPVNPRLAGGRLLNETVHARLADVPPPVDLVDVFRASAAAGECVDDAISLRDSHGIRTIWMQTGVRNDPAAARAQAAGLAVVMNRCLKTEIGRLLGSRTVGAGRS